ncbi:glycoside hydrolase family 5 protein [Acidobacteria bacterium AB60]|nr:glycoside hydrolase family 5 protein [Acidobacteria bacterium AB60]
MKKRSGAMPGRFFLGGEVTTWRVYTSVDETVDIRIQLIFALAFFASPFSFAQSSQQRIVPPLHTEGHRIVDSAGHAIRLASVNWYGFDEKEYVPGGLDHAPLPRIIELIQKIGVNSVRLPWANETVESNPAVPDYAVAANPQFKGKRAMEVMDAVIEALSRAHLMVILDNHVSRADWCCSETDGNGLWYNDQYPEEKWLADWMALARRYAHQPWVVGADLRNELRNGATWGGLNPKLDWHAAAERGGAAVLRGNSRLLVMVEGPNYSTDFRGVDKLPVRLPVDHRLVYSPHAYNTSYGKDDERFEERAGFLARMEPGAPVWFGEMGTCQKLDCAGNAEWFKGFVRDVLAKDSQLGWSYWPLNGTQSSGRTRTYDATETYGLLTPDYREIAAPELVEMLRKATQ